MTKTVGAVFENGVLRPLETLDLAEHSEAVDTVSSVTAVDPPLKSNHADPLAEFSFTVDLAILRRTLMNIVSVASHASGLPGMSPTVLNKSVNHRDTRNTESFS